MTKKLKPIGILGGTFDPIHLGHCRTALELAQSLNLAEVRFIPCKKPVHKAKTYAKPMQRKKMIELAIAAEPSLKLDTRELDRKTPSFMLETLMSLRKEVGEQPLCLILGMDALAGLDTWHQWEKLLDYAHLIVINRPDFYYQWEGVVADFIKPKIVKNSKEFLKKSAGKVLLMETTLLNVSATEIRKLIKQGKSPRYLVPEAVLKYINQHQLYL
jgi:nicotinate-nucleotide adenylyltransferase